ncbi:hypothetical protein [Spirosoma rhododendri]|uniref:Uncharacterized protein n=1 Tax=Spirosoma rhododendri TaxID=2728024 RepID=A0A7L5DIU1_9BACT|nr:hypothetical protein [Spirosoma rhododendri]QJD77985.1 hypothetical protein HH216_05785 [Spirosoma rhododendri]
MTTNKLFPDLPEYDPHPDLWNRIDADLTAADQFDKVISNLPQTDPKADLWETIEAELDGQVLPHPAVQQPKSQAGQLIRPLWVTLTAAAAVAAIVLIGFWTNRQPDASERMEYAVETGAAGAASPVPADSDADRRAEAFIAQQCAAQTIACQQPEVHELRNQLAELATEEQRLNQERQTFGDDPMLIRAQVKVENQRAEVTKELITLLRS